MKASLAATNANIVDLDQPGYAVTADPDRRKVARQEHAFSQCQRNNVQCATLAAVFRFPEPGAGVQYGDDEKIADHL